MELFDDKLLKIHPDTVVAVRRQYNLEKREDMDRAIDALEDWVKKQQHLTKTEYPRDFLERSIILAKGSVERAKSQIDNLCCMRTTMPEYFVKHDARNDFNTLDKFAYCAFLPKLTEDHYRIYAARIYNENLTPEIFMQSYQFCILKCEYLKAHDYCNGFVAVVDYREISITELISAIDVVAMHKLVNILMKGYCLRIKGVHIVTPSKAVEALVKILKPMFGPKVSQRIYVHTNVDSLYDHIPKSLLPSDLGGEQESIEVIQEQWKDVLGTKENVSYMKDVCNVVSNESYRLKDGYNLDGAGTFRSLSVD